MPCPHSAVMATPEQPKRASLGYRTFRCSRCRRSFNERTGTPFNQVQAPTDIVLLVVLWRLRYKLSLRDVAELFLERGFAFTHETVRDWEARFAPLLAAPLRSKRRGLAGAKWHADETYSKVSGRWCYRYRAIDRDGNLIDARLRATRDMGAAQQFFVQAREVAGDAPAQVTTDGHDAYPRAIRETLGDEVIHRTIRYKNNRIEQDHRGVKQRYYPMRGFGSFTSAARCCSGFEEQRLIFPVAHEAVRAGPAGRATPPIPGALGGGADRAGRSLTNSRACFELSASTSYLLRRLKSDATGDTVVGLLLLYGDGCWSASMSA